MNGDDKDNAHPRATMGVVMGFVATLLGIFSTSFTLYSTTSAGEVRAVQPLAGYALVRGIDPTFEGEPRPGEGVGLAYPSDHLILPLDWSNGTGTTVLIKQPALELHELGQNEDGAVRTAKFFFVGQLSELSPTSLTEINEKPNDFSTSIVLDPHSVAKSFMVFRVEDWAGANRCFRFHQGQRFRVDLVYEREPQDPTAMLESDVPRRQTLEFGALDSMPMLESANWLSPFGGEGVGWDYVSSAPGARAANARDLPEDATPHYREPEECS